MTSVRRRRRFFRRSADVRSPSTSVSRRLLFNGLSRRASVFAARENVKFGDDGCVGGRKVRGSMSGRGPALKVKTVGVGAVRGGFGGDGGPSSAACKGIMGR